jgi:hypothetical protein
MTSKTIQDHIKLNVGGIKYETTLNTITSNTDSMLANMFSGRHPMKLNDDGYYFIDRDGDIFKYVIKFLRDKKLNIDDIDILTIKNIKDEAEYFQIEGLIELCRQKTSPGTTLKPFSKYIFDNIINIDIKDFEKDFNGVFTFDKLFTYPYSKSGLGKLKIDYSHNYKNIPTNFTGCVDTIKFSIPIHYILTKPEYLYSCKEIINIIKKWEAMFPTECYYDSRSELFNKIVSTNTFIINQPFIEIRMIYEVIKGYKKPDYYTCILQFTCEITS